MGRFANARIPRSNYPNVTVPKAGIYAMRLTSIGLPFEANENCQRCKSKGVTENGEMCFTCQGSGRETFQRIRFRYDVPDTEWYAEEDMRNKISGAYTNRGGKSISASTMCLRLEVLTGFDDPDLLAAMPDPDINALLGRRVDVVIMPSKTGKYLRVNNVGVPGFMSGAAGPQQASEAPPSPGRFSGATGQPQTSQTARIEAPTLASVQEAYLATGRGEDEYRAWLVSQLGGAKTVTPDQRLRLMKTVSNLPRVGGQYIDSIAGEIEGLDFDPQDENEEVPF